MEVVEAALVMLPISHVLCCLTRILLCQLDIVVVEAGDPLLKQVVGAAPLLGLILHFSALVVE